MERFIKLNREILQSQIIKTLTFHLNPTIWWLSKSLNQVWFQAFLNPSLSYGLILASILKQVSFFLSFFFCENTSTTDREGEVNYTGISQSACREIMVSIHNFSNDFKFQHSTFEPRL